MHALAARLVERWVHIEGLAVAVKLRGLGLAHVLLRHAVGWVDIRLAWLVLIHDLIPLEVWQASHLLELLLLSTKHVTSFGHLSLEIL